MNTYAIVISKSEGTLTLLEEGAVLMQVRAAVGKHQGPKQREGDLRTPVGIYRICCKNAQSDYHLSLGLDYPGPGDAEEAFAAGRIDAGVLDAILAAHAAGRTPPWDTALGGEIFIHGEGDPRPWTLGCIKVANADIERVFYAVPLGTPVTINP